jgi:hypothetical protein
MREVFKKSVSKRFLGQVKDDDKASYLKVCPRRCT